MTISSEKHVIKLIEYFFESKDPKALDEALELLVSDYEVRRYWDDEHETKKP